MQQSVAKCSKVRNKVESSRSQSGSVYNKGIEPKEPLFMNLTDVVDANGDDHNDHNDHNDKNDHNHHNYHGDHDQMSTIVIAYFSAVARTVIRSCSRLQTCGHCWWQNFTTVWRLWDFLNFLLEPYLWKVLNPPTPVLMRIVPQVLFEQMTLIKNGSQLSTAQYSARNNCPSSR